MTPVTTKQFGFPVFDAFLDNLWDRPTSSLAANGLVNAAVNIKEDDDAFYVELVAPGRVKDAFKIDLNDKVLTISSEEKEVTEDKQEGKVYRKEFNYTAFKRSFSLPNTIDKENISAKYENGLLLVSLPKLEEAKPLPARVIEVG